MEVVYKKRMVYDAIFSIHISDKKLLAPFILVVNFNNMLVLEISDVIVDFDCFMISSYILIGYC